MIFVLLSQGVRWGPGVAALAQRDVALDPLPAAAAVVAALARLARAGHYRPHKQGKHGERDEGIAILFHVGHFPKILVAAVKAVAGVAKVE